MTKLEMQIFELKESVKSYANEIAYSMSRSEKEMVKELLDEIDNLSELLDDFEDMISEIWDRPEAL